MTGSINDREAALAEDGLPRAEELDAWAVPEPSADLTDRVMAAIAAGSAPQQQPPHASTQADQERVTMHATVADAPARSLLPPVVVGVAAAATILGAFWLGRSTAGSPEPAPVVVQTESAPSFAAIPTSAPAPFAPNAALPERVEVAFDIEPLSTSITLRNDQTGPMALAPADSVMLERANGDYSVELRTPDGARSIVSLVLGGEPTQQFTANVEEGTRQKQVTTRSEPARRTKKASASSRDLKDPFSRAHKDPTKTSILRIGTNPGVPPADVWIDGKMVGRTPQSQVWVKPGRHRLEFRWPGGKRIRKTVVVAAGGSKVIKAG